MQSIRRLYVAKNGVFADEAKRLLTDLQENLLIKGLTDIHIYHRYDVSGLDDAAFEAAKNMIFSEPPVDAVYDELPVGKDDTVLAVEYLPGQYDQRADSAMQCLQMLTMKNDSLVRTAQVLVLSGSLSADDVAAIKHYCINPVEAREASLDPVSTLEMPWEKPADVPVIDGFDAMDDAALKELSAHMGLAMSFDDLKFVQTYFRDEEKRNPTVTEIRVIDTYWSDHCRHTTFMTELTDVSFENGTFTAPIQRAYESYKTTRENLNRKKPQTLMDMATIAVKELKAAGKLDNLDESEEINACTIIIPVDVDGVEEEWLLLFKNETHNHPTEIEPFGGAATCLGGCIRDPLSGRSYVYQAMRVTGAGDPRQSVKDTLVGKLPQRKLTTGAAKGYSSYGNQIGLATGEVKEYYNPGFIAKRMEIGAVLGAAPRNNVVREEPLPGDIIILLGGKTGRDGCGGATGSSKKHTEESLETCGAEVQKGNPPEERKIQRLFRDGNVTRMIRRCNDFGAGGVSVAIGELADGLDIDLNAVPKKYDGLDGTELAISESQERMAVVVRAKDADAFIAAAAKENIEAVVVATVTDKNRLCMTWNGNTIVDVSRDFLNTNGCSKHVDAEVGALPTPSISCAPAGDSEKEKLLNLASTLGICLERGLVERFDGSIGASSVFMPFGGKYQLTPTQVMAATMPALNGQCETASVMAFGFDPYFTEQNPYLGASAAVIESVSKLVAAGCDFETAYLTFQEYFERLGKDPKRFGKPLSALLGAYTAQENLCLAAIGGKDSMSGSFDDMDVPPTLVSFAIAPQDASRLISPEFKEAGHPVYFFDAPYNQDGTPDYVTMKHVWNEVANLIASGKAVSAWSLTTGGIAEGIAKMSLGNKIGFAVDEGFPTDALYMKNFGGILVEASCELPAQWYVGQTTADETITIAGEKIAIDELTAAFEGKLESVFPTKAAASDEHLTKVSFTERNASAPAVKSAKPLAVIPVFPGTNCEYDSTKAFERAGAKVVTKVFKNLSAEDIRDSVEEYKKEIAKAQIVMFPGGFSAGDEPEGSAKFFATVFRNAVIREEIEKLLNERDGLMLGICNGFQALIKLGLVPEGRICEQTAESPTLAMNTIGRHISKMVYTKVVTNKSPWLAGAELGGVYCNPASHGEGRFVANDEWLKKLATNGQIATQYVDENGNATMDEFWNPNGSYMAIEGITSPDGRILGKMAHSERRGEAVAMNIYGEQDMKIFESGVKYFK